MKASQTVQTISPLSDESCHYGRLDLHYKRGSPGLNIRLTCRHDSEPERLIQTAFHKSIMLKRFVLSFPIFVVLSIYSCFFSGGNERITGDPVKSQTCLQSVSGEIPRFGHLD